MQEFWRKWKYIVLMGFVAIAVFRLYLGYIFGGTMDQVCHLMLWDLISRHRNLYTDSYILVWPPFWWICLGLWSSLWNLLVDTVPMLAGPMGPSFFLKLLYYVFEILIALTLAKYIVMAESANLQCKMNRERFLKVACIYLLLPATWVITSLHGNFDSIPAFLVIFAFLLLEFESTETSALFASALIGLAAMSRTFPAIFAFILLVYIFRKFRWTTGTFACALCIAPTFLSLYPLYLMNPDVVVRRLSYQGIPGGWWGLGGLARLLVSDQFTGKVIRFNYVVFYIAMLLLTVFLCREIWTGRSRILQAGLLMAVGLFCFAPSISNQNFYFLIPWAFWAAIVWKQKSAHVFLWFLCIDLALIYIALPTDLKNPTWFQWTYDFPQASLQQPIPSPAWLLKAIAWLTCILKRDGLDYNPFIQLLLRMPVWIALCIWFINMLKFKIYTSKSTSSPLEH